MLRLAQRQYSLLQAANLLTPDMISEFETLQQLVLEESVEHRAESPRSPGLARGDPLAQELCSESSEYHLLVQPLRPACSQGVDWAHMLANAVVGGWSLRQAMVSMHKQAKENGGVEALCASAVCPLFYTPSFSVASPSLTSAFSFSLFRISRVLWSSDQDHGKATEWSHTHSGDPTRT